MAGRVDALFWFMVSMSGLICLGVFGAMLFFIVKYRRRPGNELAQHTSGTTPIEITWTLIPLGLAMIPFVWGATLYLEEAQPPDDSLEVYVVARQWMWKVEHPEGQTEIDELHVPVGRPVKLTMISQDVIHSFYVPEFRIKTDVLPGRYTTTWFQATRPGEYHLFCAEYCGTEHSRMVGRVVVMQPAEYAAWLQSVASGVPAQQPATTAGQQPTGAPAAPQAVGGRQLFEQLGCVACHETGIGPNLQGVYGRPVQLADGQTVVADDNYIRESILNPTAKIVAGYQPLMPSFAGRVDEDQNLSLIAYIRSLGSVPSASPGPSPAPSPAISGSRAP